MALCAKAYSITVEPNLVQFFWKMEEPGTNPRVDAIHGVNIIPLGGADFVTNGAGKIADGMIGVLPTDFNSIAVASGQVAALTYDPALGITLFGWVKIDADLSPSAQTNQLIMLSGNRFFFIYNQNGTITFGSNINLPNSRAIFAFPYVSGAWNFILAWFDPIDGLSRCQINDGAIQTVAQAVVFGAEATANLSLGCASGGAGDPPSQPGWDEFGLFYGVLTAAQRTFLYNGGSGRTWPFTLP